MTANIDAENAWIDFVTTLYPAIRTLPAGTGFAISVPRFANDHGPRRLVMTFRAPQRIYNLSIPSNDRLGADTVLPVQALAQLQSLGWILPGLGRDFATHATGSDAAMLNGLAALTDDLEYFADGPIAAIAAIMIVLRNQFGVQHPCEVRIDTQPSAPLTPELAALV